MVKLKVATLIFIKLAIIWLLSLLLLSLYELALNAITHELPKEWPGIILWSWIGDFLFWLKWLFVEFLVFQVCYYAYTRLASLLSSFFITLMVILQVVLIQYFNTSLVPLGADIYGYSIADIKQTVGASGGINIFIILVILIIVVLVMASLRFLPRLIKVPFGLAVLFPVFSLILYISGSSSVAAPNYSSEFSNNLVLNKSDYFLMGTYAHFSEKDNEVDIYADEYIGDYLTSPSKTEQFAYVDEARFPFLHKDNTPDVLGPFFNKGQSKPNIVVILVEGLGRAFTNQGAYLGNFTPFLDSLSSKGLYWKNFLSQGGRTFAVLPSLVGSLPFGKNGFLELGSKMPHHLSLYSILKKNGYRTSFHYGGDASFDNMEIFLERNGVDQVSDAKSFSPGYVKMPAVNGFTWGYGDQELFRHYLSQNAAANSARLDVILTVSTHNPFLINEQGKYLTLFEKRMEALGFDEHKKDTYRNYKLQYSTILYADEALRSFFDKYKQKPEYNNTIFLITGDHRMPEIPMSTKIDRYHVPLIVYSPMLKRTASFSSVSTHFDIAPSLISFLKHNYGLSAPNASSWMGDGLDTARNFRNIHAYPLIQTKTETVDFIMGEYHLNGNILFQLNADLSEQPISNEAMLKQLTGAFNNFRQRNSKVNGGENIVPDSLYRKYAPIRK